MTPAENLLHCAATWLQRTGAPPEAVAVIRLAPAPALGFWLPGEENVRILPAIDDAAVELLETVGQAVSELLNTETGLAEREVIAASILGGAHLRLTVARALGEAVLELGHLDGRRVTIAELGRAATLQ